MKVLVVDDEKGIREVIKEYLTKEGYITLEAEDGIECLEMLNKNNDINVIILDIMMPQMDGYTTLKSLKKYITYQ